MFRIFINIILVINLEVLFKIKMRSKRVFFNKIKYWGFIIVREYLVFYILFF